LLILRPGGARVETRTASVQFIRIGVIAVSFDGAVAGRTAGPGKTSLRSTCRISRLRDAGSVRPERWPIVLRPILAAR